MDSSRRWGSRWSAPRPGYLERNSPPLEPAIRSPLCSWITSWQSRLEIAPIPRPFRSSHPPANSRKTPGFPPVRSMVDHMTVGLMAPGSTVDRGATGRGSEGISTHFSVSLWLPVNGGVQPSNLRRHGVASAAPGGVGTHGDVPDPGLTAGVDADDLGGPTGAVRVLVVLRWHR